MLTRHPALALKRPLWWFALAILLLNDSWWKYATWMPSWLSGKLSDFAGLFIFPLFLALLLSCKSPKTWLALHWLSAIAFAFFKLNTEAAQALVQAASYLGLHWQIIRDPTDLIALSILPFSYYHLPKRDEQPQRKPSRLLSTSAIALAAFASLATSTTQPPRLLSSHNGQLMLAQVSLVNASPKTVNIQVEELLNVSELDCSHSANPSYFYKRKFQSSGNWPLQAGEASTVVAKKASDSSPCTIAKITVDRSESVLLVYSNQLDTLEIPFQYALPIALQSLPNNSLILEQNAKEYFFTIKGQLRVSPWKSLDP